MSLRVAFRVPAVALVSVLASVIMTATRPLGLPHFEATVRFGRAPITAGERKLLAQRLRSAMVESFTPIT